MSSYNGKIARKTTRISSDATKSTKWINEMFLLDEILDFKPTAELDLLVSNITGKKATTVNEEEVPLLEAEAIVEDTTTEDTTTEDTTTEDTTDNDAKKAKLLAQLKGLV